MPFPKRTSAELADIQSDGMHVILAGSAKGVAESLITATVGSSCLYVVIEKKEKKREKLYIKKERKERKLSSGSSSIRCCTDCTCAL